MHSPLLLKFILYYLILNAENFEEKTDKTKENTTIAQKESITNPEYFVKILCSAVQRQTISKVILLIS